MSKVTPIIRMGCRLRWPVLAVFLLISALIFREHFRFTVVVGNSMLPNLAPGDLLLVDRHAYQEREPSRGDVVVAHDTAGLVVKRIVGLPGEEVEVKKGMVYINGAPIRETWARIRGLLEVGKGKLFDGDFASLGDNRAIPAILAIHPILSEPDIVGKVVWSLSPPAVSFFHLSR